MTDTTTELRNGGLGLRGEFVDEIPPPKFGRHQAFQYDWMEVLTPFIANPGKAGVIYAEPLSVDEEGNQTRDAQNRAGSRSLTVQRAAKKHGYNIRTATRTIDNEVRVYVTYLGPSEVVTTQATQGQVG